MSKSENQTRPTSQPVEEFLATVENEERRRDSEVLCRLMAEITGQPPTMWGPAIIGFGQYHYKYESGREGDAPAAAFSPRKQSLTVYIGGGFHKYEKELGKLGPHTTSQVCLYIRHLKDIDLSVLREIIKKSYELALTW